jgi:SAM-dependent methyltransferase
MRRRALAGMGACVALIAHAQAQAQEEVPFITTPDHVTLAMLDMARVQASDHVIDLGSGDGRIVITAARRFGATGLGVEIVPDLVQRSRESAIKAGVAQRVRFEAHDLFATELSQATVITMYLLPEVNLLLRERLLKLKPGTRVVSHDWDLGDWQPDQDQTLDVPDKAVGRDKRSRVMMWVVPAQVAGAWCAAGSTGAGSGLALRIEQRFNRASLTVRRGALAALVVDMRFSGPSGRSLVALTPSPQAQIDVLPSGDLRWRQAPTAAAHDLQGAVFSRCD